MAEFEIDQFDMAEAQLFLTSNKLYNLRSEKTFDKVMKEIPKLRIDSMMMRENDYNTYQKTNGLLVVDGLGYKVKFNNIRKPKTVFNFTDEGELCLMMIHSIMFNEQDDDGKDFRDNDLFDPIRSDSSHYGYKEFSFVLNTKLPSVDVLAARLLMS